MTELNKDCKRRDEIIFGEYVKDYCGGTRSYRGVDIGET